MEASPSEYRSGAGSLREESRGATEKGAWSERYETVQAKTQQALHASEDFVKAHPFYTVLGAATVGFVAGILMRRNH